MESEFMLSFWSDKLKCFHVYPNINASRVSITTTCIAVNAILNNPSHWEKICQWSPQDIDNQNRLTVSLEEITDSLKSANWSGDAFQTPLLLSTLSTLGAIDSSDARFCKAVEVLLEQRARLSLHRRQLYSSYVRYQNAYALLTMVENDMVPVCFKGSGEIGRAMERAFDVSFDELCRQLAFYNSGDRGNFDVIMLGYSLLTYCELGNSIFLSSYARGVVPTVNMNLVEAALKIIFENQALDGTWRKGEPIFKESDPSRRDIGNSYVFFFDFVGCLLHAFAEKQPHLLAPYITNLER
jgi:hypothetical protein